VQSIPAQGQLPQTFETSEEFEAHVEWNELKPRSTRHQTLGIGSDDKLYLLSLVDTVITSTKKVSDFYEINPDPSMADNDSVLATEENQIYFNGLATNLKAGELLLLVGEKASDTKAIVRQIVSVEADNELSRTVVQLTGVTESSGKVPKKTLNLVA